jgi:hypothetical protein
MNQDDQRPANVTDVALWKLVRTVRERHQHDDETDTCSFCAEAWPCEAEQRAMLADAAARRPLNAKRPSLAPEPSVAGPVAVEPVAVEPVAVEPIAVDNEKPVTVGADAVRHTPVWRRMSRPHRQAG